MSTGAFVGTKWNSGLATSIRSDWSTPRQIFQMLDREFSFVLDICAVAENAKCKQFVSPEEDALSLDWDRLSGCGAIWMNPPYGRELPKWIHRAAENWLSTVVALIPARTDTAWFHRCILNKAEVRFIQGRLCFDDNPRMRAPFPSMVVIFR